LKDIDLVLVVVVLILIAPQAMTLGDNTGGWGVFA